MLLIETYVAESPGMGFGLFSKNLVPKGTVIWRFVEGFDTKVHKEKYESLSEIQKKFVDEYFWKEGDYLYSSCDHSVFQNHSSNPNSITSGSLYMVASRNIEVGEELTVNYSHFDDCYTEYAHTFIQ
jgi:SET domain-containing protein